MASSVHWGDVPTWLSSSVSLVALTFAVGAVMVAYRAYQLESERDRVNAEERRKQDAFVRRSQAALVSAWWTKIEGYRARQDEHSWAVHLRNASDTPVYKVHVTVKGMGSQARRMSLERSVLPPTEAPLICPVEVPRVKAGTDQDSNGHPLVDYRVILRFTDATGVRWIRDEYGYLRELEPNLLIWTSPEGDKALTPFTAEFLATYGVTAKCDTTLIEAELEKHFIDSEESPDILIGPHDWAGSLASHRLVEPIILSDERRSHFAAEHLRAFSFQEQLYAVPSSLDTVALIRNTGLVPDVPESIEHLLDIAQELRDANAVTELLTVPVGSAGDPFHMWPMISGAGGWLFERTEDGTLDPVGLEIRTPETVAAFEKVRMLARLGVLQPKIDRLRSFELFSNRKTAFLLAASGAVVPIRTSGVDFAVSAVPAFQDGPPSVPLLTINGFYVASRGRNKAVAVDLVPDYLTRADVTEAFGRLAHVVPLRLTSECDPAITRFHELSADAVLMPSFAQMRDLWSLLSAAEMALIAGEEAAPVTQRLAGRIRALF